MKYSIFIFSPNGMKSYEKRAMDEYLKRLSRYCRLSCFVVKKEKEWEKRLSSPGEKIFVVPGPDSMSSEGFGERIGQWEMRGIGRMSFFIRGDIETPSSCGVAGSSISPEGVPVSLPDAAPVLHLSDFTLGPGTSGIILLEQIYRGYRILNHHPYHK